MDYHTWSKDATVVPVLSQLELHLLTSLAVYNRYVLKNCDIKQAFIQSKLPSDKEYFLRPPAGHLLQSLYGLKHAPKLLFEMLSNHLRSILLKP